MEINNPQLTPLSFNLLTYLWVVGLSAWGGVVNYYRKYRCCEINSFSFLEMTAEISTAAFAGVLTFLTCQAAHFTSLFTAVMVGVSGHMGSRSVAFFEQILQEKLFQKTKHENFATQQNSPINQYQYKSYKENSK